MAREGRHSREGYVLGGLQLSARGVQFPRELIQTEFFMLTNCGRLIKIKVLWNHARDVLFTLAWQASVLFPSGCPVAGGGRTPPLQRKS